MKPKQITSNNLNRIQLICSTLDVLACEAMECIEHKEGSIGIGEFPAWIQLSNTQQLLTLNRLAECVAEGIMGFYPHRAYGDAAIRVVMNTLREELGYELENNDSRVRENTNAQCDNEDSKAYFQNMIVKVMQEMKIIDSIDDMDDLDDAIWEIEESLINRSNYDVIEPYFWSREKWAADEYWAPFEYHPVEHSARFLISRLRSIVAPWLI